MIARILPPEEYHRLVGTAIDEVWRVIPPTAKVVVVEDGDQIVGCHLLLPVIHAEGLWIHPAHRGKGSVARRLWSAVQRVVREQFDAPGFWTGAMSDDVRGLLAHVGAERIPGDQYRVEL